MYKDLFISYGRRESLGFVGRLHRALKLEGYDGWFDKVNIPDGEDYALRISNGIESAVNFVYIMAPRCMKSPYCLIELEQARFWGKRIIPVNQMVIFDTEPKPLSEGDRGVMTYFYKAYGLPDANIRTEQDVLKRTFDLLGRNDWIYAREEMSEKEITDLFNWQAAYENTWRSHDDINYLKNNELPIFGKSIDPFDKVVEALISLVHKNRDYVEKHNEILQKALDWQRHQRNTHFLLVGRERQEAEAWLLREFKAPDQLPCLPSTLHAEYICESRKNGENLFTDIFISYSRQETAPCTQINRALMRHGFTTWVDLNDLEKGGQYEIAILTAIEQAAHYVLLISPEALFSPYCLRELEYGFSLNKHIIPVLIKPLDLDKAEDSKVWQLIKHLQYINLTDNENDGDFEMDLNELLNSLRTEHVYFESHRTFLVQALRWERAKQNQAFLLRGFNLENGWNWLRVHEHRSIYPPTKHHEDFIRESYAKKGQLQTEVFVSYSRKDSDFARKLNLFLQQNGKTTWFDQESIASGSDFDQEIFKGILQSENFLFVISPDALASSFCERELIFAAQNGKRFIPLLLRESADYASKLPKAYENVQWTNFASQNFEAAFPQLLGVIDTDRAHVQAHTKWQLRADEWLQNGKSADYLLNASACDNAEKWLLAYEEKAKKPNPPPTELQRIYLSGSREVIDRAKEKERKISESLRTRFRIAAGVGIVAVILAIVAVFASFQAYKEREKAQKSTLEAQESAKKALEAENASRKALTDRLRSEAAKLVHNANSLIYNGAFDDALWYLEEAFELDSTNHEIKHKIKLCKQKLGKK
jgi:TIR domain